MYLEILSTLKASTYIMFDYLFYLLAFRTFVLGLVKNICSYILTRAEVIMLTILCIYTLAYYAFKITYYSYENFPKFLLIYSHIISYYSFIILLLIFIVSMIIMSITGCFQCRLFFRICIFAFIFTIIIVFKRP